jgi:catecholate siderophore receptor
MTMPAHPAKSALAAAVLMALCTAAHAETPSDAAGVDAAADQLDTIEVNGQTLRKVSSPKYTEALRDTPQTVTVVNRDTLDQQNLLGLRDILSTLPGITFGAGEGGGGYGDSINLRGFTASSDITTDGLRDSAQYTRSDSFNLESIELVNGANSAMSGAGSVGGNINLVSKTAREGDSHAFSLGAGTDRYGRLTADSNFDFENGTAVRLNAMVHENDVPGRDHERFSRWGIAPSLAFGLGTDTRFTLGYLHQEDDNLPQYGVPYALNAFNDGPLPGIDPSTYFGYRNLSEQVIEVDALTGHFVHDFNDTVSLRSIARWQRVEQLTNVTALQGNWCLDNGRNPYTNAACAAGQPAGTWSPVGGPRGSIRDTRNDLVVSQTDLTARFSTGSVEHALVAGVSFSKETFELESGGVFFNANGSALPNTPAGYPYQTFRNPYNIWTGPLNYFRSGKSEGELENQSLYVFDTLKFGDRWLLNLGARYDRNEGSTTTWTVSAVDATRGQITGAPTVARNSEDLFSYRVGLVFKPIEAVSTYLSYANSKTPSKASVNGSCTLATPANIAAGTANCNVEAESAVNLELGAKWDAIEGRLALTAALFRNERQNYRVADPDPLNTSGEQALDGKARVDGIALGVAGHITREWAVFANYTFLDSEVLSGVSDYCIARPNTSIVAGTAVNADGRACANSVFFRDPTRGNELTNTPRHSGSVWTTYALDKWTFGFGSTYQGSFITQNSSLPTVNGSITAATLANPNAAPLYRTLDYWVHRAMLAYQISDRLGLQLNLNNLADKAYYTRIRNNAGNGWATPGEGRSATLTATYKF